MNIDPQPPRPRWTILPGDPPALAAWLRRRQDEDDAGLPPEPGWPRKTAGTSSPEPREAP